MWDVKQQPTNQPTKDIDADSRVVAVGGDKGGRIYGDKRRLDFGWRVHDGV